MPQTSTYERRRRGSRLEAFVDAAFAFAVTLLVISVGSVPETTEELLLALKQLPAFAASFALLVLLWWTHVVWSRRYALQDGRAVLLSLLLVFLVLIYVYPLRMMFASFFAWISGGRLLGALSGAHLPGAALGQQGRDLQIMFTVYAIVWITLGWVIRAMFRHAWKHRDALGLSDAERTELRGDIAALAMIPLTGMLALGFIALVSLLGYPGLSGLSGFAYALLGFSGRVARRARERALIADA